MLQNANGNNVTKSVRPTKKNTQLKAENKELQRKVYELTVSMYKQKKAWKLKDDEQQKEKERLAKTAKELEAFEQFIAVAINEQQKQVREFWQVVENQKKKLDKPVREYLQTAPSRIHKLNNLLAEAKSYSAVGSTWVPNQPVDFQMVVHNVIKQHYPKLIKRKISVSVAALPSVFSNYFLVQELMNKLVEFSISHSSDKEPTLIISTESLKNEWLFSIEFKGTWIDIESRKNIFSLSALSAGTGMGLAVCKKIVELHNGKIWIASGAGKGTVIYFTLKKD